MATMQRLYEDAVAIAENLWDSAGTEGMPDADAARGMVDSLAQAVAQNRSALLALHVPLAPDLEAQRVAVGLHRTDARVERECGREDDACSSGVATGGVNARAQTD